MTNTKEENALRRSDGKGRVDWFLIGCLGLLGVAYILMHDLTGATLLTPNFYDSYTLQAVSWLNGSAALPANYSWLELAIYDGQYYVSFPPVPSLFMLPFAAALGTAVPSNLVAAGVAIATVAFCYECFRIKGTGQRSAMFWAVFYVMGSNMLWMSTKGGVWFLAQGFNLMLVTAATWAYLGDHDAVAMALVALAVGCRPFSLCFCTALLIMIFLRASEKSGARTALKKTLLTLPAPIAVAAFLMIYNYVRFDNPLEFGHNYLPEFVEAPEGQFSLSYVPNNLYRLLLYPVQIDENLAVDTPSFDGFMFYIANPFFLIYFWILFRNGIRHELGRGDWVMFAAFLANLFMLTLHKTLGGWQFGARYTVDLLPYALFTILNAGVRRPNNAELLIGFAGIMFNIYGIFFMVVKEGFV